MRTHNRKDGPELVLLQNSRNADLQCALLGIASKLRNRSLLENKTRFDEAGRQDRAMMPFRIEQEMLRDVAQAAVKDGRPSVIAAVREATRAYFEKRCVDVLSELPAETDADLVSAYLSETASEAITEPFQAEAVLHESAVSLERASESSRSYRRKLDEFIGACDRTAQRLRNRVGPRPSHLRVS